MLNGKPERKPRLTPSLTPSQKALEKAVGSPLDEVSERRRLGEYVIKLGKKWRGHKIKDVPLSSLSFLAEKWEPSDFWEAETLKNIRKYVRLPAIKREIEEEEERRSYGRRREEGDSNGSEFDWSGKF